MSVLVMRRPALSYVSARRARIFRAGVAAIAALVLLAGLAPAQGAHAAAGDVSIDVTGLDAVSGDEPSDVGVKVRVTHPGTLQPHTPLRLLGTLTADGSPVSGQVVSLGRADGGFDQLTLDSRGRFVFPREDRAPLSLAGTPELTTEDGFSATLRLAVAGHTDYELTIALVASNERSAAVLRHSGRERIETAARISAATFNPGVDVAYIARADEFPDSLAGGPTAGLGSSPILLAYPDRLPPATAQELARLAPGRIVVLGGTAAIADSVVVELGPLTEGAVTRVFGRDRFGTAAAIALDRYPDTADTVYIATGAVFADALAGGPAAAVDDAPILLVLSDRIPQATRDALVALSPRRIIVLGGSAAIADGVVAELGDLTSAGATRYFGRTRFETSADISANTFDPAAVHTVFLATGLKFPDSLAGVPAAVVSGAPLLLVTRDAIPGAVRKEILRLGPGVIVLLGGTGVIGEEIADAVALLTRDVEPDRDHFRTLGQPWTGQFTAVGDPCETAESSAAASSFVERPVRGTVARGPLGGPSAAVESRPLGSPAPIVPLLTVDVGAQATDVTLTAPSSGSPSNQRPGGRFTATFETTGAGTYAFDYRSGGGAWTPFANPTAAGATSGGPTSVALNAPLDVGTYDLRVAFAPSGGGATQASEAPSSVNVALTVPPPLFSSLIEGVSGQSQIASVSPVGGLEPGAILKVLLSTGERTHVDYPLDGTVTVVDGAGTAELYVSRDEYAEIVYQSDPDRPSDPRITFRIDGIDVDLVHESIIAGFYRSDIDHGVSIVHPVGDGAPVASPSISDVPADRDHTGQYVSFGIHPALPAGETVTIDLADAVAAGVDYSSAKPYFDGGGHHGEPVDMPGTVAFDAQSEKLILTAGEGGWPTIQPPVEGPLPQIFIEGVATPDIEQTFTVPFSRSDRDGAGTTTFTVAPTGGLVDVAVSNLACGRHDQTQTVGVTLVRDLLDPLFVSFGGAQEGGADYSDAGVRVVKGSGDAELIVDDYDGREYAYLLYWPGPDDLDGARIELAVEGVDTDVVHESHLAGLYREDSYDGISMIFDIGAGGAFVSPYVSDLESDSEWASQFIMATPRTDLAPGETFTIDLSSAEQGGASYGNAVAFAYADHGDEYSKVDLAVVPAQSAVLTIEAGDAGMPSGTTVSVDIWDIATEAVTQTHTATFARAGGSITTQFAIRVFPTLHDAHVSDLAKDTVGQEQTVRARAVTAIEPWDTVEIDLSSAASGAVDYSGATAEVVAGGGSAELDVVTDGGHGYTAVHYTAGDDGLADGAMFEILLSGVATDDADETHDAIFLRYDSYQSTSATFHVGEGGAFIGNPAASYVAAGEDDTNQWFYVTLARDMAAGETFTIDLSDAQAGAIDYRGGAPDTWTGNGAATLTADGTSAVLTFTAPPGGLAAGTGVGTHVHGLKTEDTTASYSALFTYVPTGQTATAGFELAPGGGHHDAGTADAAGAPARLRLDGTPLRGGNG